MENSLKKRKITRKRRVLRVRKKLKGDATKPRLSFYKSNKHIYVQLIDDEKGVSIAGIGTLSKDISENKKSKAAAKELGQKIAEKAKKNNVKKVILDRGRFKYHGLLAEFAGAVRESGLEF